MARPRRPIEPHLRPDEINRRDRVCRSGNEKTDGQILWLLTRTADPATPAEVAASGVRCSIPHAITFSRGACRSST